MVTDKLIQLICTELDLSILETSICESTKPTDLPGWDSLRNVSIILRIEYVYGVKLKMVEVMRCKNISDLQTLIDSKTI